MSKTQLAKNAGFFSIAVLISRFFGLFRDIIFAHFFGTSYAADAFQVAFQIPNLLRKLFGEGALSAAFIPIYNEITSQNGDKKKHIYFGLNILSLLTFFLFIICLLGILLTPLIVKLLAPGFDEQSFHLTVKLTRIIFPYLIFIGLSSTFISILNSHDYFFIPGLTSALLNFAMVSTLLLYNFFSSSYNIETYILVLSWGVIIGGVLQSLVNLPLLKKIGYFLKLVLNLTNSNFRIFFGKFIPGVVGLAIRQVNLAADLVLASFLVTGSIAALQYGSRLMQLPLGVFGIAISTAILPMLSKYTVEKKWEKFNESLRFAIVTLIFIMVPVTVFIIGLGKDIIKILFMRGAFDQIALEMSYYALLFYSLGLVFYSLNRTLIPIFYANKDTKTPVKISIYIVVINISLNIILMSFLQHKGLAFATSLTAFIHFVVLKRIIQQKYPYIVLKSMTKNIIKIFLISLFILLNLLIINFLFNDLSFLSRVLKVFITFIIYSFFYYYMASIFKIDYISEIKEKLCTKMKLS